MVKVVNLTVLEQFTLFQVTTRISNTISNSVPRPLRDIVNRRYAVMFQYSFLCHPLSPQSSPIYFSR